MTRRTAAALLLAAAGCQPPPTQYDRPDDSDVLTLDFREPLHAFLPGDRRDRLDVDGVLEVEPRPDEPGVFTLSRRVTVLIREGDREEVLAGAERYFRRMPAELRRVGCEVRGPTGTAADGEAQWGYDYTLGDRTGAVTVRVGPVPGESPYRHLVTVEVVERAPGVRREPK